MRTNAERVQELLRVSREHALLAADPDLAADLLDVGDESKLARQEVEQERARVEIDALRERVAEAEAEAIRWGDAVVAIGEAIGMPGRGSAEIVEGVRGLRPSIVVLCRSIAAAYDALDDGNAARAVYRAEGARRCADEIEKP